MFSPQPSAQDRRTFIKWMLGAAAGTALAGLNFRDGHAAPRKPSILLIVADDLGAECLSCYGSTTYKTPHLDALAANGLRFDNAFSTPLCTPSRVQLMTGRYPFRTGWTNLIERGGMEKHFNQEKEFTFGHLAKQAGYATAVAGKWQLCYFDKHPDHAKQCGFDESCLWVWKDGKEKTSRYWAPSVWQNGKPRKAGGNAFGPDLYCDFLIDFMTRHKDQPFFAYFPMALVHDPFVKVPGQNGGGEEAADGEGGKKKKGKGKGKGKGNDGGKFRGMVEYMDVIVGRLVAALEKLGIAENTLVMFTGDNGTPNSIKSKLGEATIPGGKNEMTEAGTRVPFIAYWKGKTPRGVVTRDLMDFSDVFPTVGELMGSGGKPGVPIDGRSFAPQLQGQPGTPRDWIYVERGNERFVRDARWRLHKDGKLYDLKDDRYTDKPAETDAPEAKAAAQRLKKVLDGLRK